MAVGLCGRKIAYCLPRLAGCDRSSPLEAILKRAALLARASRPGPQGLPPICQGHSLGFQPRREFSRRRENQNVYDAVRERHGNKAPHPLANFSTLPLKARPEIVRNIWGIPDGIGHVRVNTIRQLDLKSRINNFNQNHHEISTLRVSGLSGHRHAAKYTRLCEQPQTRL